MKRILLGVFCAALLAFTPALAADAPREPGSYTSTGTPWLGLSETRTLRGMTVRKT